MIDLLFSFISYQYSTQYLHSSLLYFRGESIAIFLGRFTTVPKPLTDSSSSFGVHSVICCPDHHPDLADLGPEEEYDDYNYDDLEYNSDYDFVKPSPPPMVQFFSALISFISNS